MSCSIEESCPRCMKLTSKQNRLITDSCGHIKCRDCFLRDEDDCTECKQQEQQHADRNLDKEENNVKDKSLGEKINPKSSHIKEVHNKDGSKQYQCTICTKTFRSRSQKYYHLACGNETSKKFKCDQCDKRFSSNSHYKYHMESHSSNKFECAKCMKTFGNRTVLKKHQKAHDVQPVSCVECGKTYRFAESLVAHMHQHRNDLQFKCNICDKKYAVKSTLQQHMLKHQAKKHQCHLCKKRFQRNSTLKSHLKRHSKTERHMCTVCHKQFSDSAARLRHCKMHNETIKYKCRRCDITSIRKDNMLRHVRNIHTGEHFDSCVETMTPTQIQQSSTETPTIVTEPPNMPKTIRNSSVIKCIGNVEPVQIEESQKEDQPEKQTAVVIKQKKVKPKYDPIEMYRRILISDEEIDADHDNESLPSGCVKGRNDLNEGVAAGSAMTRTTSEQHRGPLNTPSNFSEMHWRKNFKYTYQFQDY